MARYGTFKYGDGTKYGGTALPFDFHVVIRDASDRAVRLERDSVVALNWTYAREGGCQSATLELKRDLCDYGLVGPEFIVEIFITPAVGSTKELTWTGFVDPLSPSLARRQVAIQARGLSAWMQRLVVPNVNYLNQTDIADVVKNIVDTYVVVGSKIKRTAALGLVATSGVAVDNMTFATTCLDAIRTLAVLAGNFDWGVRADREFYFLPKVSTVTHWLREGALPALDESEIPTLLTELNPQFTKRGRLNWLYLQAGDGLIYTIQDAAYESNNQAEALQLASSVKSATDASILGASIISRANGQTIAVDERFPGLTGGALELLTPHDYEASSFSIIYPTGYVQDADETEPTIAKHYSVQADNRVLVLMGATDTLVIGQYNVKTGGDLGDATVEGVRVPFEREALPLGAVGLYTDKWRNRRLAINSITYTATENGLRARLQLGEVRTNLADLHEAIQFTQEQLRAGLL